MTRPFGHGLLVACVLITANAAHAGDRGPDLTVLTPKEANSLFKTMAGQHDIAFSYPDDGCYARAQLMASRMQSLGVTPGKIWAFAQGDQFKTRPDLPTALVARTPNHPNGSVSWKYHVAPLVAVRGDDGKTYGFIIDPALFKNPVSLKDWKRSLMADTREPYISKTRLGEPPVQPDGIKARGTGYWPGESPRDPDAAARKVMDELLAKDASRRVRR